MIFLSLDKYDKNIIKLLNKIKLSSISFTVVLLSIGIVTAISFLENEDAFAYGPYVPRQAYDTLIVETDKTSYIRGEIVAVTGTVQEYHEDEIIRMTVYYPNGRSAEMLKLDVDAGKNFSVEIETNDFSKNGEYKIRSYYGKHSEISEIYFTLNDK